MNKILQISNVSKSFNRQNVLRNISFEISQGEVVAVIGPSGSGKTTMLRCMAMLETVDDGTITIGNIPVVADGIYSSKNILKQARRKCSMVFQNFNLFPHMSVLQNIMDAPVNVLKISPQQARSEAEQLLGQMDLISHTDAYPCELSGGQQQRVAIARALALHPDILFFDEPTSALDPELTREVLRVIRELACKKMTMIIVTHEMDFAEMVADRIVFMADGMIVEEGAASEIIHHPVQTRTKLFIEGMKSGF